MKIFYRILFIIVAICIPVTAVFTAANIVFRMPDLYVYEFNNNQVADEIDLGISDEELGQFFSDFMIGKMEEFDLVTDYRDREQAVFGTGEQINMEHARTLLNRTLYVLGGALILTVLSYWILLAKKKKLELRIAFKAGVFVFTAMQIMIYLFFYIAQLRTFFFNKIFIVAFGADDALPLMLTGEFARLSLVASTVISLVLLIILASVTWKLTKPRRMFWQ